MIVIGSQNGVAYDVSQIKTSSESMLYQFEIAVTDTLDINIADDWLDSVLFIPSEISVISTAGGSSAFDAIGYALSEKIGSFNKYKDCKLDIPKFIRNLQITCKIVGEGQVSAIVNVNYRSKRFESHKQVIHRG